MRKIPVHPVPATARGSASTPLPALRLVHVLSCQVNLCDVRELTFHRRWKQQLQSAIILHEMRIDLMMILNPLQSYFPANQRIDIRREFGEIILTVHPRDLLESDITDAISNSCARVVVMTLRCRRCYLIYVRILRQWIVSSGIQ